jgi:hypothetical protein
VSKLKCYCFPTNWSFLFYFYSFPTINNTVIIYNLILDEIDAFLCALKNVKSRRPANKKKSKKRKNATTQQKQQKGKYDELRDCTLMFSFKESLTSGVQAAYDKLKEYYSKTDASNVYSIAVAMDPSLKYKYWENEGWNDVDEGETNYYNLATSMVKEEWEGAFKNKQTENGDEDDDNSEGSSSEEISSEDEEYYYDDDPDGDETALGSFYQKR